MKTLLVYPEFPNTYWSFRHALSFEGKRSAFPPLGLLTISALLPEAWERRLVDLNIQPLKLADIEWADVVFASPCSCRRSRFGASSSSAKRTGSAWSSAGRM